MDERCIPKDLLYKELADASRPVGWLRLRFKNIWKRDIQTYNINSAVWETLLAIGYTGVLWWPESPRVWKEVVEREKRVRGKHSRPQAIAMHWLHPLDLCPMSALFVARTAAWELDFLATDNTMVTELLCCLHHCLSTQMVATKNSGLTNQTSAL